MQRNQKEQQLKKEWEIEENIELTGWDFSRIANNHQEGLLFWRYEELIQSVIKETDLLLDMGTADGRFLMGLNHPYNLTSVTEAYPPNIALCKQTLEPLGMTVYAVTDDAALPIAQKRFDCVINRHEAYCVSEVARILKPGGYFITQQVGGLNNAEIAQFIMPHQLKSLNTKNFLREKVKELEESGFEVEVQFEAFPFTTFKDVGAFVYFAKRIEWEFPDFSVDSAFPQLLILEKLIRRQGYFVVKEHRFVIVARKK